MPAAERTESARPRLMRLLALAAVLAGGAAAVARAWIADDAYISFRYARNLVEGLGLVFNPAERVEGYTNFLWTLWIALGLGAGADAASFATWSGVASYAALLVLLARRSVAQGAGQRAVPPVAALGCAATPCLWDFATGGLETALFCLLSMLGLLRVRAAAGRGLMACVGAGLLLGLCVLTRPDGAVFVLPAVAYLAGLGGRVGSGWRSALALLGGVALPVLPHLAFRLSYYGELVPNTFYAKSADQAWYPQGLAYAGFFLLQHWALALALVASVVLLLRRPGGERRAALGDLLLFGGAVLGYGYYVVRVGGDFMHARLLVPVVAPSLWLVERAVAPWSMPRKLLAAAALCGALALSPVPSQQAMWQSGIVQERGFPDPTRNQPGRSPTVARFVEGLPLVVGFSGGDARLMYEARVPVAIELETGLTDAVIARQSLRARGRVGHEKHARLDYLVLQRRAHLTFRLRGLQILGEPERTPVVEVQMGEVRAFLLRWDPEIVTALRARGAKVMDFPAQLGAQIERLRSRAQARALLRKLRPFYFDSAHDAQARALERRLRARAGHRD